MIAALDIVIATLLVFAVIGLLCAAKIGWARPLPPDPFSQPFGEMPGFTDAQLRELAWRSEMRAARDPQRRSFASRPMPARDPNLESAEATRRRHAGGGGLSVPSRLAAVRNFLRASA